MLFSNAKILVDKYDLSGDHNMVGLETSVAQKDDTTFDGTGMMSYAAGLKTARVEAEGLTSFGTGLQDEIHFSKLGVVDVPLTIAPPGTEGGAAYILRALILSYAPAARGRIGELLPFSLSAEARFPALTGPGDIHPTAVIQGGLLAIGTKNANGNSAAGALLGALASSSNYMWGSLHVIAVTGGITVTVAIQRAATPDFASPSTVFTFTPFSAAQAVFGSLFNGPSASGYYRATWSLSGAGSVTFGLAIGIL